MGVQSNAKPPSSLHQSEPLLSNAFVSTWMRLTMDI
ncbi:hypothetical protein Pint_07022 [Pistacia integerrima]|uniref:Uncharacterized protein n=1 Tax=Pistacia integerrima TaxID=434235 RepID=A0ACC0XXP0_9ROSI|nr:hypothetical protein Pint_07022 [Pistacia integerrima]